MPIAAVVLALALVLGPAVATAAAGPSPGFSYMTEFPEPLVRVPFPDRPAGEGPAARMVVQVQVGEDGFVRNVRFGGGGLPADSTEIAARVRRWIFRPARGDDGRFHEVWVAIPLPRTDRRWLARPDSLLLSRVRANAATAFRLLPPNEASLDSVRRTGRKPALFARHWVLGAQPDSTGALADSLVALLQDPAAYAGRDPVARRCFPEPALGIDIPGSDPDAWTQVLVSFGCGFLQVTTPEAVLHVPFGSAGAPLRAAAARLFPGDPAFAAAPAPHRAR